MPEAAGNRSLVATRDAPIGGQAVLEGVMMRGVRTWAVAVRAPAPGRPPGSRGIRGGDSPPPADDLGDAGPGEIVVTSAPLVSWARRHRILRLPVLRGAVALAESLALGLRALSISAAAQLPEEEAEISGGVWAGTVAISLVFAVGLFFVVPVGVTSLIRHQLHSSVLFWVVEGLLRTGIFLGYLLLLSRIRDLRRVFEYHGAEHKVISCHEAGDELTPDRARLYSRLHPRCGTSFLLVVMIVSIFVFAPVGLPAWYVLVATRILGVPLIAGLSFELIRWAGRNRSRGWVKAGMAPGLRLQLLTTREPDREQLAVAIAALAAVLVAERPDELASDELVGLEVVA